MASSLFFNGRLYITPAAPSQVNDTAMAPTGLTVGNVLAIIGQSSDGEPNSVITFGDPSEVVPMLVDGELSVACQKAFSAADDLNAPSEVLAIRVGTSTPATLTLNDGTANPVIVLSSNSYGVLANLAKVRVQSGSTLGKLLSTAKGTATYLQDNVARASFTIQYSGAAATAVMTINNSTVVLQAPTGTTVSTIPLATYQSVMQLADAISAVPGFAATAVSGSENTVTLNGLDSITSQDVKTALYTARADLQAAIDWFNSNGDGLMTATRPAGAGAPPVNIGWTYMAGGTDPAVLTQDWVNALTVLQGVDCQWVVALSGDPAIHAAVDAHVQFMSTVGRKERRALCGPPAGTSLTGVQALPLAIDSDRTSIVWPGYYDYNASGALTLYAPYMTAVLVAAGFAGSTPGTPMTNKTFTIRALEYAPRDPVDTDVLIQAGVLSMEVTTEGYKCVRSISTWLANNNFNRVEVSCGAATDYTVRTVRNAVDPFRGSRGSPFVLAQVEETVKTALTALSVPEPVGPAILVGDATNPPWRNVSATLTGDVISVSYECSPVIPVNFIPQTASIVPYTGTVSG